MGAIDVPNVNGVYWAFADITAMCGPGQFYGFKSINYTDKLARNYVRGTNRMPLGFTSGQYEAGGDFELYLPQADAFIQFLLAQGVGRGYMQVPFQFVVSYAAAPEGAPLPAITDELTGCVITDVEASQSEGLDALVRKFTFMSLSLTRGGAFGVTPLTGIGVIG